MPEWANELVTQVCKDYRRKKPVVKWWSNHHTYSHGHWKRWSQAIFISAGESIQDQELVLLHELAHHIVGKTKAGRRQSHSIRFWTLAFELYNRYGVDTNYAIEREYSYKAKAKDGHRKAVLASTPRV